MTDSVAGTLRGRLAAGQPPRTSERWVEWTIESRKTYSDPFNEVDIDVIFTHGASEWRVPMFWRGRQRWTVRFAPPHPGEYHYRLESTDRFNPDLNGHEGRVTISAYCGRSYLLRHGMLRVSATHRYLEHADGTPFFWLGDTWWTGLSDRLSWSGFRKLTADRKAKGFTVVQTVAGLIPPEELAPTDPGYRNEGGPVWDVDFTHINPKYFDAADRRIQHLIDSDIVPAVVGAWNQHLPALGLAKMKQHWRYLIARYGAYPVFWIVGGELSSKQQDSSANRFPSPHQELIQRGWTEVARYVRETDPYHHPLSAHEVPPPFDSPLEDESLTDFALLQSGHMGWASIATQVAQLNSRYVRATDTKPLVQGEIGYERLGEIHLQDFQRTAFWLAMLNGAAGHTYGANGVWEAYTADKPLHRYRYSFLTWQEGMGLPGSYQVGLAAKLLREYPWWRIEPHPEWVTPGGTTFLEQGSCIDEIGRALGSAAGQIAGTRNDSDAVSTAGAERHTDRGNYRLPYAAGIPGELRMIYTPTQLDYLPSTPSTVLGLEEGIRYYGYFWEPSTGTKIDLGLIERPALGPPLFEDSFQAAQSGAWLSPRGSSADGEFAMVRDFHDENAVMSVELIGDVTAALLFRFKDAENYVAAVYSPEDRSVYLVDRRKGLDGPPLGRTVVRTIDTRVSLRAEVRNSKAAASVTDGQHVYRTPIVDLETRDAGGAGLLSRAENGVKRFNRFMLYCSPILINESKVERKLHDATRKYRGELRGAELAIGSLRVAGWDDFGREKHILLDAYRPERMPAPGDWLLVLERNYTNPAVGGIH